MICQTDAELMYSGVQLLSVFKKPHWHTSLRIPNMAWNKHLFIIEYTMKFAAVFTIRKRWAIGWSIPTATGLMNFQSTLEMISGMLQIINITLTMRIILHSRSCCIRPLLWLPEILTVESAGTQNEREIKVLHTIIMITGSAYNSSPVLIIKYVW